METVVAILFVAILVYVVYQFVNAKTPLDTVNEVSKATEAAEAAVEKAKEELQEVVQEAVKKARKSRKKTDDTTS